MSSINTNAGAMTALQTLKATNKNLEITQGRISTGARVNEAAHNAAYWSIATTMRSDNNAMSTVKDALGLGAAQVDIAYTAMDAVKDTLDTMKSKLVAASQPDVDKAKIQEEIKQLQNDLKTFAESANFSGGNWLSVDSASTQQVVASFVRNDAGVSLETIDIDTGKTALFTTGGTSGLLEGTAQVTPGATDISTSGLSVGTGVVGDGSAPATGVVEGFQDWADTNLPATGNFSFTLALDGSATSTQFTAELGGSGSAGALTAINAALASVYGATPPVVASIDTGTGNLVFTGATTSGSKIEVRNLSAQDRGTGATAQNVTVTDFNIASLDRNDIQTLIKHVDTVLGSVTTAASDLGAIKTRIGSQQEFVGKIMDAVGRGVGQLVDADMEEESTRLQALQVQQQLGIQALSIANGNTQNILSLFR